MAKIKNNGKKRLVNIDIESSEDDPLSRSKGAIKDKTEGNEDKPLAEKRLARH